MTGHGKYAYKNERAKTRRAARRVKALQQIAFIAWRGDESMAWGLGQ